MNAPDRIDRIAYLIWAATPDRPELVVTPLIHALAARALDAEVEIHFAGPAVRWLVSGDAEAQFATADREKPISTFLQEAAAAGVTLLACSMASAAWVGEKEQLIAACNGQAGATAYVARLLDPAWKTAVF